MEWLKHNGLYIESAGDTPSAAPTKEDVLELVSHFTHSRRAELEHVDAPIRLLVSTGPLDEQIYPGDVEVALACANSKGSVTDNQRPPPAILGGNTP